MELQGPDISRLISETARSRLESMMGGRVEVGPAERADTVFIPWLVLILLSGPQLRITLKIHFRMHQVRRLAAPLYGVSVEDLKEDQAIDYVRELLNVCAGGVKKELGDVGSTLGLSLPIVLRGIDDFFFLAEERSGVQACWCLSLNGSQLVLSSLTEVFEDTK